MSKDIKLSNVLLKLTGLLQYLPISMQKKIANTYIDNMFNKDIKIRIKNGNVVKETEGPVIFIANHLSNLDGVVLTRILKKFDPYFVAGVKLSKDNFTNFFKHIVKTIEIKPNSADIDSIRAIINTIKNGDSVMMFPEGTRSRTGGMIEAKKGILLIGKLTKATIIPISLMGTEKVLPINEAGEMSKERPNKGEIKVVVGEPFKVREKRADEDKNVYEDTVLNEIMVSIAKNLDEEYRGFYGDKI